MDNYLNTWFMIRKKDNFLILEIIMLQKQFPKSISKLNNKVHQVSDGLNFGNSFKTNINK